MNSRRLQHFLAVFEHRGFGRAAEELHVTKPALSKSIQLLEEELNVVLFERTASGVVPTLYADTLALYAKAVEAEMRNASREIARLSGAMKGEVKVGITPSVAAYLMPRTFLKLQDERPSITFNIVEGIMDHHLLALRQGDLDFVIGGWVPGVYPDLATEVVQRDDVRVFAGAKHPLAGKKNVPLKSLLDYAWVLPPPTQFWLQLFEKSFVSQGLQPPIPNAVTNSPSFIKATLLDHKYLSALPARSLNNEVQFGEIVALPVAEMAIAIDITVSYRKRDEHLTACNMFIAALKTACQTSPTLARAAS